MNLKNHEALLDIAIEIDVYLMVLNVENTLIRYDMNMENRKSVTFSHIIKLLYENIIQNTKKTP